MIISEIHLRSIIREAILKENPIMTSNRQYLETITWKGKTYRALGFLGRPPAPAVALVDKNDLSPEDVSTSGTFKLLPYKKTPIINTDDYGRRLDLSVYKGGKVVPVSVASDNSDVTLNYSTVNYGDPSGADWAIEVGGVLGALPLLGEPVDIASAILAIYKDPPDYLLAAISVVCAIPVIGVGAAFARPILRKLRSGREIGERIGELALEQGGEELTTTAVREAREAAEEIIEAVSENAPENVAGFGRLREVVSDTFDGIDAWISRDVPLDGVREHLRDRVVDAANLMRGMGLEFTEDTFAKSGAETINFINAKFDGKEVVAKAADDGFKDAELWRRLEEIEKIVPDRFKKFIPEIYKITRRSPVGALQSGTSIVIMEKLLPLSDSLRNIISPSIFSRINVGREGIELAGPASRQTRRRVAGEPLAGDTHVPRINNQTISDSLEIASDIYMRNNNVPPPPGIEWSKYVPSTDWLYRHLRDESAFNLWKKATGRAGRDFAEDVTITTASKKVLIEYVKDSWEFWAKDQGLPALKDTFLGRVRRGRGRAEEFFSDFWTDFVDTNLVRLRPDQYAFPPTSYNRALDLDSISPEVREFFEFLIYMAEKHEFFFGDMHVGNIMRDAAGNLKLMDLGHFRMDE